MSHKPIIRRNIAKSVLEKYGRNITEKNKRNIMIKTKILYK